MSDSRRFILTEAEFNAINRLISENLGDSYVSCKMEPQEVQALARVWAKWNPEQPEEVSAIEAISKLGMAPMEEAG